MAIYITFTFTFTVTFTKTLVTSRLNCLIRPHGLDTQNTVSDLTNNLIRFDPIDNPIQFVNNKKILSDPKVMIRPKIRFNPADLI